MIESDMRGQLVKILRPLGAFAVENGGCHPGTPDIAYRSGWIECKATEQWPARPEPENRGRASEGYLAALCTLEGEFEQPGEEARPTRTIFGTLWDRPAGADRQTA